ncbi:MAG: PKD domain-containing protein [Chitinophagales bacterium]|nr:PKD domain-containing protein [Chitinophagales bacterium]
MIKRLTLLFFLIVVSHLIQAQVNASFVANQTAGCPNPFLMILNDNSTGGPFTSYNWTITGPAGYVPPPPGTSNQFTQALTIPGFYSITLTVCNGPQCDTFVGANAIEVYARPTIAMNVTSLSGCPPHQTCFDGTFTAGCGTITSSFIDVKDGTVYTNVEDVCHNYALSGNYSNFTVSVTNSCGCITTQNVPVTVSVSPAPIANFTANQTFSCNPPLNVNFTNTSTSTNAGSVYTWSIPALGFTSNSQNISQSFGVGSYDVQLIVSNPNGCSDTILRPNYIVVGDPNANFTSNVTAVCPNGTVNFTNLSSGTPSSTLWTFEGHGTSTAVSPSRQFTTPGTWDVTLISTYPGGCADTITIPNYITVYNQPTNNFTVSDSSSCSIPFTTTFTNTSTNAATTTWSFPGGTPSTGTGAGPFNITYNTLGSKNVTMTSTSAQGCVRTTGFANVITVSQLQVQIIADSTSGCSPWAVDFDYSLNLGEVAATTNWTFTGGSPASSNLPNPLVTYTNSGCYDVVLNVTSTNGCTGSATANDIVCVGNAPVGSFVATPNDICFEEEEVCVTYTGSPADSLWWYFGDPAPPVWASVGAVTCHSYSNELGDFSITLVPFNNGCPGDTVIYVDTVHVLGPIAAFSSAFDGCPTWNTFNFTDESTDADSIYYTFGDPTTNLDFSSLPDPSWTYPAIDSIKTYTVTQYAYSSITGCEHQVSNDIVVYPPNAQFTFNNSVGCAPQTIQFQNTSFFPGSGNNTIWNWNGANVYSGPSPGGSVWTPNSPANRTFSVPGTYSVGLRNSDNRGCLDTLFRPNLIQIHGIISGFTQNTTSGCAPLEVNFVDTSVAPLTFVASWHWDFGVPSLTDDTANIPNPTFIYTNEGVYNVSLTVVDSFGCVRVVNRTISVFGPNASFSVSDTFVCNNQSINITNLSTGSNLDYNWQFSNASPISDTTASPGTITFNAEGIQSVFLEVTDNLGCSSDTTISVSVFNVVADGFANLDSVTCFANIVPISFSNTSYNNIDSSSVWWDLGNGTTSNLFNPSAIYNVAGTYQISMSIASNTGCVDTAVIDTIVVGGPYANIAVLNEDTGCLCHTVSFEITSWNANNTSFIPGDGTIIPYVPNGLLGDTIVDTLQYQYCTVGNFVPQVFIDDGNCSGNVLLNDTLLIDSIVINFTFDDSNLCDSGQICFTDLSVSQVLGASGINSWLWDFGDGDTSSQQNPCHFYTNPGAYYVSLVVGNLTGCFDTLIIEAYIPFSPIVAIDIADSTACFSLDAFFYDSTQIDPRATISSWFWDFGDINSLADTAVTQNSNYFFDQIGQSYTSLVVVDSFGCIGRDSILMEIFALPTVLAGQDQSICYGDSAQLSASGAQSFIWTPNWFISDTSVFDPFVFPISDTSYIVQGIDTNSCSNYDTLSVEVNLIQANFTSSLACLGDSMLFTDLSSSDGNIISWNWDFDEPASGANNTSVLQNPAHLYATVGSFDVLLEIEDDNSCTIDTLIPVFINQAPIASFVADSACLGSPNNFDASISNGSGANITSYHWDFGISSSTSDTSNLLNPSFTYPTVGSYTVCLTIFTDQLCAGNSDDTCYIVEVFTLPTADFEADTVCQNNPSSFIDLSTAGNGGSIVSSTWNFGQTIGDTLQINGSPANTSFTYTSFGSYNASLTLVDSRACTAQVSKQVEVIALPSVSFSAASFCQNEDNTFVSLPEIGLDSLYAVENYYWNFDEGAGFVQGDSIQVFSFAVSGSHNIRHVVENEFGCTDTFAQTVFINPAPIAVITGDNTVCSGTSTNLSGASSTVSVPPASYNWSVSAGQTSNITYLPSADGPVSLVVVDGNGCSDSTFIDIDVLEAADVDFEWTDACEDIQFTVNSTSTPGDGAIISYAWTLNSNSSGVANFVGQSFNYQVTSLDTISVNLTVVDINTCVSSFTQNIIVDQQVDLSFLASDTFLCPGQSIVFDINDTTQFTAVGVGSVLWSPASSIDDPNSEVVVLSPTLPTTYQVIAYSTLNQCPPDEENSIFVDLAPDPVIELDAVPNPVLAGATSSITALVIPFDFSTDSLIWEDPNGSLNTLLGFNIEASPLEETNYPVQLVYLYHGYYCTKDTFINIQILDVCNGEIIYAPNIFTPNNDGKNDVYKLSGYGIDVVSSLRVFDRWGQVMYDGANLEVDNGRMVTGWDGNNREGKACNSGVYVYTYELVCANGDIVKGSGNITLIK